MTGPPCAHILVSCVHHNHGSWALIAWSMYGVHVSMVYWLHISLVKAQTTRQGRLVNGLAGQRVGCCSILPSLLFLGLLLLAQTWFVLRETWRTTLFRIYYCLEVVRIENHSHILEITC